MDFLNFFQNDLKIIFPEMFLTIGICLILVYGVVYNSLGDNTNSSIRSNVAAEVNWLSILIIIITVLLIINNPINNILIFKNTLIIDDFTSFIKLIVLISTIAVILISLKYIKKEKIDVFEYPILILLAVTGMLLIVSSYDLISMYLAIELQSLSLYVLASFKRNSELSTEAGLKYFILGAFSSGLLLFGSSLIYGFTGSTNFGDFALITTGMNSDYISSSSGLIIGLIFLVSGLLFKVAAVPFHMWAPDVYEGSPTSITAFFAIVPKVAILAIIARILFFSFYDLIIYWQDILLLVSIMSMVVGAFAALYQKNIKRFLAYSGIGHIGYVLIGICTGTTQGISALIFYMIVYIIMTLNAFTIVLSLRKNDNSGNEAQNITDLQALAKLNPLLAITLALNLFSMAGVPPLAGFFSKYYLFSAAIESSLYLIALIGVLTSVIAAFYYIRIIKIMYFEDAAEPLVIFDIDKEKGIILGMTSFFLVFFFIYPSPILIAIHKVALTLCL